MDPQDLIIALARRRGRLRAMEVARRLRVSRQAATNHLRRLVAAGQLVKLGSTKAARYVLAELETFRMRARLRGLREEDVFDRAARQLHLRKRLSPFAFRIAQYAFTEMLNNAIDHSRAASVEVAVRCANAQFTFEVVDRGIGVFESVRRKFRLPDHFVAAEHLLKGKQSADPKRHSGQGIFFTSKIADRFVLESARLRLAVDNGVDDVFFEDISSRRGTRVRFELTARSHKNLKELFDKYSNAEYEFDKTKITVHLSERQGLHVSRSEAKRLLFGLEKFRRVLFDFKKVSSIGQGFADEIFRVYQATHPRVQIEAIHAAPSVQFMITRARRG